MTSEVRKLVDLAFASIAEFEKVQLADDATKQKNGIHPSWDVWEIRTEIQSGSGHIQEITLYVYFDYDFPFSLPRVVLSNDDYEKTKHIPHLSPGGLICVFETESVRTIPGNPAGIIYDTIKKAKKIIQEGIAKSNLGDFEKEFISYWSYKYSPNDEVFTVLSLLHEKPAKISLLWLNESFLKFNYILHQNDATAERFKEFLTTHNRRFSETEVLLLDKINFDELPPLEFSNSKIFQKIKLLHKSERDKFKTYINSTIYPKCIVFCKEVFGVKNYLGWFHRPPIVERNGFRAGTITQYKALSSFQSHENVIRILPEVYTPQRLSYRTSGELKNTEEYIFLVAGLGSIGSNLTYLLNSIGTPEFRLVDTDFLQLENIGRHFLGLAHVGQYKTKAIGNFLREKNPLQNISTFEHSILSVYSGKVDYLNEADYIFIAIGKRNIEKCLSDALKSGSLVKPIFILWVEPYLAGGHLIYLHPTGKDYDTFHNENDLFKFNVIHEDEYKNENPLLSLKEAGCHTVYTPYSNDSMISFLAQMFPVIHKMILEKPSESTSFTWVGNTEKLSEMKIKLSKQYQSHTKGTVIENKI